LVDHSDCDYDVELAVVQVVGDPLHVSTDPVYSNSRIDPLRWMHADQAIHRVLQEYEELSDVGTYAMFRPREATRPIP